MEMTSYNLRHAGMSLVLVSLAGLDTAHLLWLNSELINKEASWKGMYYTSLSIQ